MYKKHKIKDAEFVESKDEFGYKEVIEDFSKAEYINILTYNISKSKNVLLDELKKAGTRGIPITVVTNIPQRFETYFASSSSDPRKNARANIKLYERKLKPETIGELAKVFFMFDNHGKIIMTNNVIYWGSSNYSDESKKSYECGVLCRDKEFIRYINEEVFPGIVSDSVSYYAKAYNACLASLYSVVTYMHNMYSEIYDASYGIYSDYDTGFRDKEYFDYYNNYISKSMLTDIIEALGNAEDILQTLFYSSDVDAADEKDVKKITDRYENYIDVKKDKIWDLYNKLYDMVTFDAEEYANDLINGEYAAYSYDENLEDYVQIAVNEASEKMQELIEDSKPAIEELLQEMEGMDDELFDFIYEVRELAKVNEEIDNT